MVWLVAVGDGLLVLWRLLEAVVGHHDEDGADLWRSRAVDVLKAGIYGALGFAAVNVARGGGSGGGDQDGDDLGEADGPARGASGWSGSSASP